MMMLDRPASSSKMTEKELRRRKERYCRLYNETPAMLHSIDQEGRLVSVSNYWLEILGYRRSEVLGRGLTEFFSEESRRYAEEIVLPEFFRTGFVKEVQYQLVKKNGEVLDTLLSAIAEKDHEGRVVRSLAVIIDVTEHKKAQKEIEKLNTKLAARTIELENANRELEAFNQTVSHDLRTPLTVISGYAQTIHDSCGRSLNSHCQGYHMKIADEALRMSELIDTFLEFSDSTHNTLRSETVDLSAIVYDVASVLNLAEPERRVAFRIADGVLVKGDAKLLRVVLENLIGNAWKYTGRQKEAAIRFDVADIDGKTTCFVKDNGPGFDMAHAEKLFAPFQRLPGSKEFTGHGIGLATTDRIIRRHGGRIWAEAFPGKGATFYFTLPA